MLDIRICCIRQVGFDSLVLKCNNFHEGFVGSNWPGEFYVYYLPQLRHSSGLIQSPLGPLTKSGGHKHVGFIYDTGSQSYGLSQFFSQPRHVAICGYKHEVAGIRRSERKVSYFSLVPVKQLFVIETYHNR